jgi:hypothetical protein
VRETAVRQRRDPPAITGNSVVNYDIADNSIAGYAIVDNWVIRLWWVADNSIAGYAIVDNWVIGELPAMS